MSFSANNVLNVEKKLFFDFDDRSIDRDKRKSFDDVLRFWFLKNRFELLGTHWKKKLSEYKIWQKSYLKTHV